MAIVKVKPTSPGRRAMVKVVNKDLHKASRTLRSSTRRAPRLAATTTVGSRRVTRAVVTSTTTA